MFVRITGWITRARSWIQSRTRLGRRGLQSALGAAAAEYTIVVAAIAIVVIAAVALLGDALAAKLVEIARRIPEL